jgi:hypothetical protein
MKNVLILISEVCGLLIIFALFLLVLGYFNIITLPNFSPKTTISTTKPVNLGAVNNDSSSEKAAVSFAKLQHQASDTQIREYMTMATGFDEPTKSTSPSGYVSNGVFSGYDSQTIQVVTKDGVLNLGLNANTHFLEYAPRKQNAGAGIVGPAANPTNIVSDFFKNTSFGKVIQIFYSKPDLKIIQIDFKLGQ